MIFHVLPGDAIVETFQNSGIEGEVIVCRECLVDGSLAGGTLDEFWNNRADFIDSAYGGNREKYFHSVAKELEKLLNLQPGDKVNLWFEYELFCSVNLWFCLYLLRDTAAEVYRVEPIVRREISKWEGFGGLEINNLENCFSVRVQLSPSDIETGAALWEAYSRGENEKLRKLAIINSKAFPMLPEVVEAAVERSKLPKQILQEIAGEGITEFSEMFAEFSRRAGIYGFGDAQVKRLLQSGA